MSVDRETIAIYDTRSHDYADRRFGRSAEPGLVEFVAAMPEGGHILDMGCGPGDSAHRFLEAGFTVDAVDASPGMVSRAREFGVPARQGTFDDIDGADLYDGLFVSYSLLHVPRDTVPGYLARFRRALKPRGIFHLGMKLGAGEKRDGLGRLYVYYTEAELMGLLRDAGFTPTASERQVDTGLDGSEYHGIWIHADG